MRLKENIDAVELLYEGTPIDMEYTVDKEQQYKDDNQLVCHCLLLFLLLFLFRFFVALSNEGFFFKFRSKPSIVLF